MASRRRRGHQRRDGEQGHGDIEADGGGGGGEILMEEEPVLRTQPHFELLRNEKFRYKILFKSG